MFSSFSCVISHFWRHWSLGLDFAIFGLLPIPVFFVCSFSIAGWSDEKPDLETQGEFEIIFPRKSGSRKGDVEPCARADVKTSLTATARRGAAQTQQSLSLGRVPPVSECTSRTSTTFSPILPNFTHTPSHLVTPGLPSAALRCCAAAGRMGHDPSSHLVGLPAGSAVRAAARSHHYQMIGSGQDQGSLYRERCEE